MQINKVSTLPAFRSTPQNKENNQTELNNTTKKDATFGFRLIETSIETPVNAALIAATAMFTKLLTDDPKFQVKGLLKKINNVLKIKREDAVLVTTFISAATIFLLHDLRKAIREKDGKI